MRLNEMLDAPARAVCIMLASCVRENSRSHSLRIDSCMIMGPMERTCSTSTCTKRSEAACNAEPSWFEMMAEECTMSSNTVVHHASLSSLLTAPRPARLSSRSITQRSGRVSRALRSSNRALRRSSSALKSCCWSSAPAGVVASTVSRAVRLLMSCSWVAMMSSSFGGSTGQPPCGTNRRHCSP